jgi:ubiquinone biosynthesis protein COQ9
MAMTDATADAPAAASGDWADLAEQRVLDAALGLAPKLGWGSRLVAEAAGVAGLSPGEAELLLPNGARDLAALLSRRHDAAALAVLSLLDLKSLKMRQRIAHGATARVDAAMRDEAAVRRWTGFLALPGNLPLAARLTWESADLIWRWAGDIATDENHYSKRAILSAILASTLAVRLSSGRQEASAYLAARIDNVMAFETWKHKQKPVTILRDLAEALGQVRYGQARYGRAAERRLNPPAGSAG